jgi:hypothetical protein
MNWMVCTAADQLPALLEGVLCSALDPAEANMSEDQVAIKRMMGLEY